jgi:CspA family cold shock protein
METTAVQIVQGTVKWFNNAKGYGFLGRDDGGSDVFVHYSGIIGTRYRTLNECDRVEFEIGGRTKGPQPANVWRLDGGLEGPRIKEGRK